MNEPNVVLPPSSPTVDDMEIGLEMAAKTPGCHLKTQGDCNFAARFAERERQLLASIAENRQIKEELDACRSSLDIEQKDSDVHLQRAEKYEAENRQKDAEVASFKDRVSFSRLDNSHPATHCLRLLADFNISVGKACEYLSKYFLTGQTDPIAEELHLYDSVLDEVAASDIARRMRKAEAELAELRSLGGERWIDFASEKPAYGEPVEILFPGPALALCHLEREELADDNMREIQDILWDDNADQERSMRGIYWRKFAPPTREKE